MKCAFQFQMSTNVFVMIIHLMLFKRMFGDRNVHKIFSALNFAVICVKPFTSNRTTFSVSFFNAEWKIITHHLWLHSNPHITLTDWLTGSIHKWYLFPNVSISYNSVSYFHFYVICSYFQQETKFWLIHLCFKDV